VTVYRTQPDEGSADSRPLGVSGPRSGDAAAWRGSQSDLTERVVDRKVLHRGRYLEFAIYTIERPDGSRSTRDIVGHPGAVSVLAVDDDDNVLLVRQYRVATGDTLLEIPAGTLDVDHDSGRVEDPARAAARELEEETGYRARAWKRIASFWTAPGFASEYMHLYLATDLVPADADRLGPDEDEHLELVRLPITHAVSAAERGDIKDAKSLVGLFWLARMAKPATTDGAAAGVTSGVRNSTAEGSAVDIGAAGVASLPAAPVPIAQIVAPPGAPIPGDRRVVEAEFTLRSSDIYAANMALSRSNRVLLAEAIVVVCVGVLLLLNGAVAAALVALVVGLAGLFGVVSVPVVWFRMRQRPDLFGKKSSIAADDVGIRYDTAFATGTYPWSAFRRVREHDGFMFFDTGIGPSLFVPLAAFRPEALSHLRKLVLAAGFGPDGRPVQRR
jgi:ADP-ribose pyrophosphatase